MNSSDYSKIVSGRIKRALVIKESGGIEQALLAGALDKYVDLTLSEAIVLGLLRQGVRKYVGIFGHGSTEVGEVLRVYEEAGLVKTYNVRNEVEAAHAAMALRWVTSEKAAVFTSIGPGALQAMAGSLAAASDSASGSSRCCRRRWPTRAPGTGPDCPETAMGRYAVPYVQNP